MPGFRFQVSGEEEEGKRGRREEGVRCQVPVKRRTGSEAFSLIPETSCN
jgi:hypothetical protein